MANDLLALALGRMFLQYANTIDLDQIVEQIKCSSMENLVAIQEILEHDTWDDFKCVEEIVTLLNSIGLETSRHDFS